MVRNRAQRHVVAALQVPYGEQDGMLGGTERQGRRDLLSKQAQQRHGGIHVRDERSHLGIVHRNVAGAQAGLGAPARAATDIRCTDRSGIGRNSCSWMPPWPLPRLLQASLLRQSTKDRSPIPTGRSSRLKTSVLAGPVTSLRHLHGGHQLLDLLLALVPRS